MKKALKINLSGQIFHIDEDAYEKLKVYLDTISSHFSNVSESKEILTDIEMRIAELFREKMSDENQVISIKEVDEVIDIMGRPEEIADEEDTSSTQSHREKRSQRRLYRDPDNAVLGGVSSGLSAYFNLDMLLIRILFIVLTFASGGTILLLYIILWIAVPRAETAAEKLEMRGEKVNVSNLEKAVKEEYEDVKENLKKARNSEGFRRTEDAFTGILKTLGIIITVFFKIVLGFVAFILIVTGIAMLFGTVGFLFFGAHFIPFGGDIQHTFPEMIQPFVNPENASIFILAVLLIILIPVLALIYGMFKVLFRFKAKDRVLGLGATTLWVLSLIAALMILFYEGKNFRESDTVSDTKILTAFNSDTLFLSINTAELNKLDSDYHMNIDNKWYFDEEMESFIGNIDINVKKSPDSDFKVRIEKTARGRDNETAQLLAQSIEYKFTQNGSSLTLDPFYLLGEDGKWRAQSVELTVYVPFGKAVKFAKNTEDFIGWVQNTEDFSDWEVAGKTLLMKENGLGYPISK